MSGMTAEEFIEGYSFRSGRPVRELLERGRVVATCECGADVCAGWQLVNPESLLPWRNERIVITADNYKETP